MDKILSIKNVLDQGPLDFLSFLKERPPKTLIGYSYAAHDNPLCAWIGDRIGSPDSVRIVEESFVLNNDRERMPYWAVVYNEAINLLNNRISVETALVIFDLYIAPKLR